MPTSNAEYSTMTKKASPPSKILQHCITSFIVGGLICTLGQFMTNMYKLAGLDQKIASMATTVSLIFLAVVCTAFQFYDNIARFAGAGTLVPITGFANAIASPAIEFKKEGYVMGVGVKMFSIAGPVIVYGTIASIVYGLIIWILRLI